MKQREVTFLIIALLLAAAIGSVVGNIIGGLIPEGPVRTVLITEVKQGFEAIKVDFYAISITFGLMFRLNFMSVLFILLVIVYFRWWYL